MTPSLSDDPYRYRWEGKLQAAGGNPYQVRPRDPPWAQLRDSAFPRVVGKDFKAVYGPLIEQVELWTYRVVSASVSDAESQVFWFKLPYALCDLAAIWGLWLLLSAHIAGRALDPAETARLQLALVLYARVVLFKGLLPQLVLAFALWPSAPHPSDISLNSLPTINGRTS